MICSRDLISNPGVKINVYPLQLHAGQNAGCETACMPCCVQFFDDDTTEAAIFVDATNAFILIFNRQVTLHNCKFICPPLCPTLINTYRKLPSLFFVDGENQFNLQRRNNPRGPCCYVNVQHWIQTIHTEITEHSKTSLAY